MYGEVLPEQCPPAHANDNGYPQAFRLVANDPPVAADFRSKAAEGKACAKNVDPCQWASCSLFTAWPGELVKLGRIRRRYSHVATLSIQQGVGRSLAASGHVDYWRYANVDLSSFVTAVAEI